MEKSTNSDMEFPVTTKRKVTVFASVLVIIFNVFNSVASQDVAPALGLSVIQKTKESYRQLSLTQRDEGKALLPLFAYFDELTTNWSETLHSQPKELNSLVSGVHEDMQFYFAGRKEYANRNLETLLHPRIPLSGGFDDALKRQLARPDLEIRMAWFRLLNDLDLNSVISEDHELITEGVTLQYLSDFRQGYLSAELTEPDFNLIMQYLNKLPSFSDEEIKTLVKLHEKRFPKLGYFGNTNSCPDRLLAYTEHLKPLSAPDYSAINTFYNQLYKKRTDIFSSRLLALQSWVGVLLDHISDGLNASEKLADGKHEMVAHYSKFLEESLWRLENNSIPPATNELINYHVVITEKEMGLVLELNKYLRFRGEQFDVDFLGKLTNVIPLLQAGDWTNAVTIAQPDNSSINAALPIAILADFAKRSTNDTFKADLMIIRSKLEGLRTLAGKMEAQ